MSLPADPSVASSSTGNIYGGGTFQSLAASASVTKGVDFSSSTLGGFVQVLSKGGGTVATTNGCQVQAFSTSDGGTTYDTVAFGGANFTIANTVSTTSVQSLFLPTGKFNIQLTNLDTTNAISVQITSAPVA